MSTRYTSVDQIPADFPSDEQKGVFNPLDEDFRFLFLGKERVIRANRKEVWPTPLAAHCAKHLAKKIVADNLVAYLKSKFPGEDEHGRPKWKLQGMLYSSKEEISKLRDELMFDPEKIEDINIEKPEVAGPVTEKVEDSQPILSDNSEMPSIDKTIAEVKKRKGGKK